MKDIISSIVIIYIIIAFFVIAYNALNNYEESWGATVARGIFWFAFAARSVYRGIKEIW